MMLGLELLSVPPASTEAAATHFETSLRLFGGLDERWREATVLGYLGLLPLLAGDYPGASECFRQSLAVARSAEDRVTIRQALSS